MYTNGKIVSITAARQDVGMRSQGSTRLTGIVVIGCVLLTWLPACSPATDPNAGGEPVANEVLMRNIAFDPAEITITAGETVTWRNVDLVPHTATSGNPGDADAGTVFRAPGTDLLNSGESASQTFNDVGEFIYFCEVHPGTMRDAKVIVLAP